MPCYDDGASWAANSSTAKERLDRATRLLCAICREADHSQVMTNEEKEDLRQWYEEHKKADNERKNR